MINHITGTVVFPTNGVSLKADFSPQPGLTAVIGPNGSGKTFSTIELTRYLLYGKAALRGAAPDYVNIKAKGDFTIKGARYVIERNAKKEELVDSQGLSLATGADAVTAKVVELMGYGLKVFDIANASVQRKAAIFGEMRPAERKKMIDEVVGLTTYEAAEKACRNEATFFRREAESLTRVLREPIEPVRPENYEPSGNLADALADVRDRKRRADAIANQMRPAYDPQEPVYDRPTDKAIEALVQYQSQRQGIIEEMGRLRSIMDRAFLQPKYTYDELDAAEYRLFHGDPITCPKCQHVFYLDGEPAVVGGPVLTSQQIADQRKGLQMKLQFNEASKAWAKLKRPDDKMEELNRLQAAKAVWDQYDHNVAVSKEQRERNLKAEQELRDFGDIPSDGYLDDLTHKHTDAVVYEKELARYGTDKAEFDKNIASITDKEKMAEEYKKGAEALSDARATLKAYLAPSLSHAASSLLRDMTYGKLTDVVVDEDMEISVNGQPIETLSGGGETVTNIALRLALGQVLVGDTFPVFLGDEMDGDADDVRREATLAAMASLKDRLKQIILITHRGVEIADHILDFGDTTYSAS